jgi:hypothetical protein
MYNSSCYTDFRNKNCTIKDDNRESKGKVTGNVPITVTFLLSYFPLKKNITDFLPKYSFTTWPFWYELCTKPITLYMTAW